MGKFSVTYKVENYIWTCKIINRATGKSGEGTGLSKKNSADAAWDDYYYDPIKMIDQDWNLQPPSPPKDNVKEKERDLGWLYQLIIILIIALLAWFVLIKPIWAYIMSWVNYNGPTSH